MSFVFRMAEFALVKRRIERETPRVAGVSKRKWVVNALNGGNACVSQLLGRRAEKSQSAKVFWREIIARTGDRHRAENIGDHALLREVMNTVGKPGRLGDSIRCVVSVAMLTEGWDANTVIHVLGIRAFGTQLLCEPVIGRALRR